MGLVVHQPQEHLHIIEIKHPIEPKVGPFVAVDKPSDEKRDVKGVHMPVGVEVCGVKSA